MRRWSTGGLTDSAEGFGGPPQRQRRRRPSRDACTPPPASMCIGRALALPFIAVILAVWLRAAPAAATTIRAVAIHADDGGSFAATMWEPSQRPAPAVVLLHMQARNKDDWQQLGAKLGDAGITALAIDVRALGPAAGGDLDAQLDPASMLADVRAAVDFLATRTEVRPGSIGIVGASMGANLAILAGAVDPRVGSLALLSAGVDYRGLRVTSALKKYAERPALFVVSTKDPYAVRSLREFTRESPGIRERRLTEVAAHGTMLLSRDPDLVGAIVEWFRRTIF